jgi:hypothetical protein
MNTTNVKKARVTGKAGKAGKVAPTTTTAANGANVQPKVSAYRVEVLDVNKALNEERPTFEGALKVLTALLPKNAPLKVKNMVILAAKGEKVSGKALTSKTNAKAYETYQTLRNETKSSKKGRYSPFGIIQAIRRINKK